MVDPLDHPIWAALTSEHGAVALGGELARRYPSAMSTLAAIRDDSREAFAELRELVPAGEAVGLFTVDRVEPPAGWTLVRSRPIEQMRLADEPPGGDFIEPVALGRADVPEMLALTALTQPGPFYADTLLMGRYVGIRAPDGRLAAMAGERLRLSSHTELSAVCTHPDFQGRGYGAAAVVALLRHAADQGRGSFLHVKGENDARRLYERLGFRHRRTLQRHGDRRVDRTRSGGFLAPPPWSVSSPKALPSRS